MGIAGNTSSYAMRKTYALLMVQSLYTSISFTGKPGGAKGDEAEAVLKRRRSMEEKASGKRGGEAPLPAYQMLAA